MIMATLIALAFVMSSCTLFPTGRNDNGRSLNFIFKDPNSPETSNYTESWHFLTGNWVVSSPAVSDDGTVYVGSIDHYLYATDSQGKKKWSVELAGPVISSPLISGENIYVTAASLSSLSTSDMNATGTGYLYKISTSGSKSILYTFPGIVGTSPVVDSNGVVYVGCLDRKMYAINQDGTKKWSFMTGGRIGSSPSLSSDESTLYFGSEDGYLYALNTSNGSEKWRFKTQSAIISSPAIDASGTIYIGSLDNCVYAVKKDGTLAWKYDTGSRIGSSPSISNGIVYVGNESGDLYAIDASNGQLKWSYKTGGYIMSSPAIDSNGTVYVGSADGNLYAISPNGVLNWKFPTGDVVGSSPAIGSDGTIYFGSNSGYVYAIHVDGIRLAAGPWAMFRKNSSHSAIGTTLNGLKLLGDFNENGKLDFDDLMSLAMAWNSKKGDSRYHTEYDIGPADDTNGDGVYDEAHPDGKIGFDDLMVFAMNWGKTPIYASNQVGNFPQDLKIERTNSSKFTTMKIDVSNISGFDLIIRENGAVFVKKSGLDSDILLLKEKNGLLEVMAAGNDKKLNGTLVLEFKASDSEKTNLKILWEGCK